MIKVINVDLDNVIYDLWGAYSVLDGFNCQRYWFEYIQESGIPMNEYIRQTFDDKVVEGLFRIGNQLPQAKSLLDHLSIIRDVTNVRINLVGAIPVKSKCRAEIRYQKNLWLTRNCFIDYFDEIIFTNGSSDKINYCGPDTILIDDYKKTQEEFVKKGFPFILYRNFADTVVKLSELIPDDGSLITLV